MRENEQCLSQQTGCCKGCPVLSLLRDELRNETTYDVRDWIIQTDAAIKVSKDNCPEGLIPEIDQLIIERKGNGWTGRYLTINIR